MAAAILGTAVVALIGLQESAVRREAMAGQLVRASRAARALVAEAELLSPLTEGRERGRLEALPGAVFRRNVELWTQVQNIRLYRIHVAVDYAGEAGPGTFELEKYVLRGGRAGAQ